MYNYPFFSFPHFSRYTPYYSGRTYTARQPTKNQIYSSITNSANVNGDLHRKPCKEILKDPIEEKSSPKKAPTGFSFLNNFLHQEDRGDEEELFNLFGIKLYHDDILLIGLIFFLYQEDVKDQYLFFALILLLLS